MCAKRRMSSLESSNPQRKRIRSLLEERLIKKSKVATSATSTPMIDINLIQRQAAAVEELLYRKHLKRRQDFSQHQNNESNLINSDADDDQLYGCYTTSGEEGYSDTTCVDDEKINIVLNRHLLVFLTQATQKRHEKQGNQDLRQAALLKCLGIDKYKRATILLKMMDQIGFELTGNCCRSTSECPDRMRLTKGSIPQPVRQLFHQTSLRTLMYFTPISQLHLLSWDDLLEKAEQNIHEYTMWALQCKPNRLSSPMSELQMTCSTTTTTTTTNNNKNNIKTDISASSSCAESNTVTEACSLLMSKSCPH